MTVVEENRVRQKTREMPCYFCSRGLSGTPSSPGIEVYETTDKESEKVIIVEYICARGCSDCSALGPYRELDRIDRGKKEGTILPNAVILTSER